MSENSHRWVADHETSTAIQQVDRIVRSRVRSDTVLPGVRDQILDPAAKHLRPLLVLLAARAGGRPLCSRALRAAAAVEIIHEATLVHDDMVDASVNRRGRVSAQSRHGLRRSAYSGSALMYGAMALTADLPDEVREATARTASLMARGQVEEVTRAHDHSVTPLRRLRIMYGKTASLFRLAALCGARLGEVDARVAGELVRAAGIYGMAYQLADDLRDLYIATSEDADLSRCDISDGVSTLPVLFSLTDRMSVVGRIRSIREQIASGEQVSGAEIRDAARLIVDGDGALLALRVLTDWNTRAAECLALVRSEIPLDVFSSLGALLDSVDPESIEFSRAASEVAVACPT